MSGDTYITLLLLGWKKEELKGTLTEISVQHGFLHFHIYHSPGDIRPEMGTSEEMRVPLDPHSSVQSHLLQLTKAYLIFGIFSNHL
jgi:hypothetical protein